MNSLEINPSLKYGKLKNGVSYCIQPNPYPADLIELRLVVKVGSLMEKDVEQGFAHFIEHLGFKGTRKFQQYDLVKVLQSLGVTYGPDLNASTHLLETKYTLSLTSGHDMSHLRLGIDILKEWAFHMTISDSNVNEERQIISSEYLAKQGLGERLLAKYWKCVFTSEESNSSPIASRMPIGIPEIFMNCSSSALLEFYKKWYVPSNMTVILAGAVGEKEDAVIRMLEEVFDEPDDAIDGTEVSVGADPLFEIVWPTHSSDVVVSMCDNELTSTQLSMEYFSSYQSSNSMSFVKMNLQHRLLSSIIDARMNLLTKLDTRYTLPAGLTLYYNSQGAQTIADENPFLSIGVSIREVIRGLICVGLTAMLRRGKDGVNTCLLSEISVALRSLLLELRRIQLHGIHDEEFYSAKAKWRSVFIEQRDFGRTSSSTVASDLTSYVLHNGNAVFSDPVREAEYSLECLESISKEDMIVALSQLDMHLEVEKSCYFKEPGAFRVLSGQFPGKSTGSDTNIVTDELLSKLLIEARTAVANVSDKLVIEWPRRSAISEIDVIRAAQQALSVHRKQRPATSPDVSLSLASLKFDADYDISELYCNFCSGPTAKPPSAGIYKLGTCSCCVTNKICGRENVSIKRISAIDAVEYTLENGIKVCAKWMAAASPGKVSMQGFSLGGSSELTEPEEAIMAMLDSIAGQSRFRITDSNASDPTFSIECSDLNTLSSISKTRVNTQRHFYHRGIGGSSPSDKFELLLSLMILKFTAQEIDKSSFESFIRQQMGLLQFNDNSPEYTFMNRARELTCGDIAICRPLTIETLQQCTHEMAVDLYNRGFMSDPTEFTFVFTGDIPAESEFMRILANTLGKLRSNKSSASQQSMLRRSDWVTLSKAIIPPYSCEQNHRQIYPFTDLDSFKITSQVFETVSVRQSEKASKLVGFRVQMPVYLENYLILSSILLESTCKYLQICLLDELRVKLGKVYTVAVEATKNSLSTLTLISIVLHCDPNDTELIREVIESKIRNLQTQELLAEDHIPGIIEGMLRAHKQACENSSNWLFWILDSYKTYSVHEYVVNAGVVPTCSDFWCHDAVQGDKYFEGCDDTISSADSVGRHCGAKGQYKSVLIKDFVSAKNIQFTLNKCFVLGKSVHIDLLPKSS